MQGLDVCVGFVISAICVRLVISPIGGAVCAAYDSCLQHSPGLLCRMHKGVKPDYVQWSPFQRAFTLSVQVENAMEILRAADAEGDNSLAPHTPVFTGMRGGEAPVAASGPTSAAADATSSSGSVNSTDHAASNHREAPPAGVLLGWSANCEDKAQDGLVSPSSAIVPGGLANQPRWQPGAKPLHNNGIPNRAPTAPPAEVKRDLAAAMAKLDITK